MRGFHTVSVLWIRGATGWYTVVRIIAVKVMPLVPRPRVPGLHLVILHWENSRVVLPALALHERRAEEPSTLLRSGVTLEMFAELHGRDPVEGFRVGPGATSGLRVDVHSTVFTRGFGQSEAAVVDAMSREGEGRVFLVRGQLYGRFTVISVRQAGRNATSGQRSWKPYFSFLPTNLKKSGIKDGDVGQYKKNRPI